MGAAIFTLVVLALMIGPKILDQINKNRFTDFLIKNYFGIGRLFWHKNKAIAFDFNSGDIAIANENTGIIFRNIQISRIVVETRSKIWGTYVTILIETTDANHASLSFKFKIKAREKASIRGELVGSITSAWKRNGIEVETPMVTDEAGS